jgi:hypothetical protein
MLGFVLTGPAIVSHMATAGQKRTLSSRGIRINELHKKALR